MGKDTRAEMGGTQHYEAARMVGGSGKARGMHGRKKKDQAAVTPEQLEENRQKVLARIR